MIYSLLISYKEETQSEDLGVLGGLQFSRVSLEAQRLVKNISVFTFFYT